MEMPVVIGEPKWSDAAGRDRVCVDLACRGIHDRGKQQCDIKCNKKTCNTRLKALKALHEKLSTLPGGADCLAAAH